MRYTTTRTHGALSRVPGVAALLAGLVLVIAGCGLLAPESGPEYLQGDATGGTYSDSSTATANVDYRIAVNAGSFYVITVESSTGNIDLFVYGDEEQTNLLESAETYGTGTEIVSLNTLTNDTLYVNLRVFFPEGETSHDYTIDVIENTP